MLLFLVQLEGIAHQLALFLKLGMGPVWQDTIALISK